MSEDDQTPTEEPEAAQIDAEGSQEDEQDMFPRSYVEELRAEAAENRKKAAQVDTLRDALRAAYLQEGTRGILHDPEALDWSDDFDGENGLPDVERIRAAAEELAQAKPWLSRARGDVGQGFRGEDSDAVDLAGLLRAGA